MTASPTKQFIKDEIARGAAPALAANQTLREVVDTELRTAYEDAVAAGDTARAAEVMRELLGDL